MNLKPGWVDEIAKPVAADKAAPVPPPSKRKSPRRSAEHDRNCGLRGSRNGGSDTVRKLDRLLGKVDEG